MSAQEVMTSNEQKNKKELKSIVVYVIIRK